LINVSLILQMTKVGALDADLLERTRHSTGQSLAQILDSMALVVAREYLEGNLSFDAADHVMNELFAFAVRYKELPEFMDSVYVAFDAGEYARHGDPNDVDPREKYTKPMLKEALRCPPVA
jgi:hypothetical protein